MAAAPLAGNKIHSLPVQVSYHLPSSAQTFTSLFPSPQQVYVHAAPGHGEVGKSEEAWGAIYLKSVVQGIVMASPELHPAHPGCPDHSLYVLDPRETFLRRTRTAAATAPTEVWTGKGLVSWALEEPGVEKSLITGRLVRRAEFSSIRPSVPGLNALEALVAANAHASADGAAWGIELCVGLRPGTNSATFPPPLHATVESGCAAGVSLFPDGLPLNHIETAPSASSSGPHSELSSHSSLQQEKPKLPRGRPPSKKKKAAAAAAERDKLQRIDQNVPPQPANSNSFVRADDFIGLPSQIYARPDSMTKDQAQRLLESPAFLHILEKLTGAPVRLAMDKAREEAEAKKKAEAEKLKAEAAKKEAEKKAEAEKKKAEAAKSTASKKRPSTSQEQGSGPAKRKYIPRASSSAATPSVTKCYNCGTTKSSVWRTKMVDEKMERVCNACGLYYNKTKTMRPPILWSSIPAPETEGSEKNQEAKSTDKQSPGVKRTPTQAAESDTKQTANDSASKPNARQTRAAVHKAPAPKAVPMTSPPRAPTAARMVRNSTFAASTTAAASSPGGWVRAPASEAPKSTPTPAPQDSPISAVRRAAAENSRNLAMPLSDDGDGRTPTGGVSTEASAFFDVDGFSMKPGSGSASGPGPITRRAAAHLHSPTRRHSEADVSSTVKARPQSVRSASSEDDVFSQLFQRTSSVGDFASSPAPFDFSQLPPSSPPSLPSNLPHSALLLSSPSGSPMDPSPRPESECSSKVSPPMSGLRHSVTATPPPEERESKEGIKDKPPQTPGSQSFHDILSKISEGSVSNADELLALFNNFPAANA